MSGRGRASPEFNSWQLQAINELKELARLEPRELRITRKPCRNAEGIAVVRIALKTDEFTPGPGGLPVQPHEELILGIGTSPLIPPRAEVEHARFVGHAHVLQGVRLCVYLDPSREWNPAGGMSAFLNRLRQWFSDAVGGRFDAATAMYHAVGGVLHQGEDVPTIVIRDAVAHVKLQLGRLVERTPNRFDLQFDGLGSANVRLPVLTLSGPLPHGASSSLWTLLGAIDGSSLGSAEESGLDTSSVGFLTSLAASATRNLDGSSQYFVLAVPHPRGGAAHLLCGRLSPQFANSLRGEVAKYGLARALSRVTAGPGSEIEWCRVSDEREEVSTRRDHDRPVSGFLGKDVQVWGCGGIGSWMAEFVARAGASRITLCDPGVVTGGLLVRQNFVETDVGDTKAEALARRLRALRDDLIVEVAEGSTPDDLEAALTTADVVIDATVSIAIGQLLDALASITGRRAVLAQVATDSRSGTLGLLHVLAPGSDSSLMELDENAGGVVLSSSDLELYHALWQNPIDGDELIPTRGCSVPTFHGSAADIAGVSASLAGLLGIHLTSRDSGTHVLALPYASPGPRHRFLPPRTKAGK